MSPLRTLPIKSLLFATINIQHKESKHEILLLSNTNKKPNMSLIRNVLESPFDPHFGSGFDDTFSSPFFSHTPMPFLTSVNRDPDMRLCRSSPCYEITENDEQFQLAIDVPGVKMADIDIHVGGEKDRALHISGGRNVHKTGKDGSVTDSQSRFEKTFKLHDTVDTSKITAKLQDGVLTLTAPKKVEEIVASKKIPITEVHS